MNIRIGYETLYTYAKPVSFSPHVYRLFPKVDPDRAVRRLEFKTNADAVVHFRRDLFDNEIASCFYPERSAHLEVSLHIELEVKEKNAFGFLLAAHAVEFPFAYRPEELRALVPYLATEPFDGLPFWQPPDAPAPTMQVLTSLNGALHGNLKYAQRPEGAAFPPGDTLARGGGACRDFAVLLAAELRRHGVAARLVSGYLCEFGVQERRAQGSLHAWTEAYLPGAGWVGFDPTNGVLCTHNHLSAAVGISPEDIAPAVGRYFHETNVPAQMATSLQIDEIG